jgi:hypothetical protein
MIKQILYCKNCDNRFYDDLITDKICKYCETLDHEDIEILDPSELNVCKCKQCKQMKEVA